MQKINTLIFPRWIIPLEPDNTVLEHHAVAVDQGKILAVLDKSQALRLYEARENITLDHHALLPGFVNAHAHTPMTLFRGLADDLALMDWLENHIWPAETKWLSDAFCYDGTQLAIAEMLRGGITCFNEHYFFLEAIGRAAEEAGIRAALGVCVLDFRTAYGNTVDNYLNKAESIYQHYKNHALISTTIAPHSPYTLSDESFLKIKAFAEQYQLNMHIHLQETQAEIAQSAIRPVKRLYDLGLLSTKLQAVHLTQVSDTDIDILSETGVHVIHCPESNLKLASGFCPVKKLMDAGINIALGTDGAASNNDLDMLGEMKTAALLAKAMSHNPTALNAFEALKMATLNGARAMGLDHLTGSLLPRKSADMIAINLDYPNTQPVFNPISQIVYAAHSHQVSDVWIAGKQLLKNHQFVSLDIEAVMQKAAVWRDKI